MDKKVDFFLCSSRSLFFLQFFKDYVQCERVNIGGNGNKTFFFMFTTMYLFFYGSLSFSLSLYPLRLNFKFA